MAPAQGPSAQIKIRGLWEYVAAGGGNEQVVGGEVTLVFLPGELGRVRKGKKGMEEEEEY